MSSRRGSSLVEVLVAFSILLVTTATATSAVVSYICTNEAQSTLTQAMAIAESKVEDLLVLWSGPGKPMQIWTTSSC